MSEAAPNDTAKPPPSPQECEHAWQHVLHEEDVFNDRLNFFLLAEAMLLVFHAEVIGKIGESSLLMIGLLGLVITILWVVINARQISDLEQAKTKCRSCLAHYKDYDEQAEKMRGRLRRSALPILGYAVPFLIALIWIALIGETLAD